MLGEEKGIFKEAHEGHIDVYEIAALHLSTK